MKTFEQLVVESLGGEFKLILWCSWFNLIDDKHKKQITQIFEWFARPHPQGFVLAFHITMNADMFRDVKVDYSFTEEKGPKIVLSNIKVENKNVVVFLLEELIHRSFGNIFRNNKITDYLKTTFLEKLPGYNLYKTPTIDGEIIDVYGKMKKKLPELEGIF
jgi:hypothetical protein